MTGIKYKVKIFLGSPIPRLTFKLHSSRSLKLMDLSYVMEILDKF